MEPLYVSVNPSSSKECSLMSENHGYEDVPSTQIVFPDFRHLKRLGRGSYGTVVQCYFRGRLAAAKLVETNVDYVHIQNEAKLLHEFKHENIIELYAAFHGDQSGLVLELMEGGSLNELLHRNHHIRYEACHVLGWAMQVTSALCYLHGRGYVHRDLKPSNLLLTYDYITLKLCDFGTAVDLRTSMTNNRGSAAWMAPEVFRGKKYDQKCDIFSFGILLWEMIARKQPFDDWDTNPYTILWQVSEGRRPSIIGDCPEPLMDLIKRCWSDNPKERPYIEEVSGIIEVLCQIFPNRFLPLIDRTTGEQAFALRDTQSLQKIETRSSVPPPIPPPPDISASIRGHRRGASHDFRRLQPDQAATCGGTSFHSTSDLNALSSSPSSRLHYNSCGSGGYSPNVTPINPMSSVYNNYAVQVSTPIPNARAPYNPCLTSIMTPPPPPLPPASGGGSGVLPPQPISFHSQSSNSSTGGTSVAGATSFAQIINNAPIYSPAGAGEIGWRRSSEPPVGSDSDTSNRTLEKRKKSYGFRKFLNDIKKELTK